MAREKVPAPRPPRKKPTPDGLAEELERGPSLRQVARRMGVDVRRIRRLVAADPLLHRAFFRPPSLVEAWGKAEKGAIDVEAKILRASGGLDYAQLRALHQAAVEARAVADYYAHNLNRAKRAPRLAAALKGTL